jgi:Zn/Cd-binding protein ZinT
MPYRRSGNKVLHKKGSKWSVKQTCKSPAAAEAAIRLLRGVDHGVKPRKRKKG